MPSGLMPGMGLVGGAVHQLLPLVGIGDLNANHPTITVGVAVDEFGLGLKKRINLNNFPAEGHVQVRNGLDGLHGAKDLLALQTFALAIQFDKDDISQFTLGKIGDPYGGDIAIQGNPFVFGGVSEIRGKFHCWIKFRILYELIAKK